jgi:hypothetical protein
MSHAQARAYANEGAHRKSTAQKGAHSLGAILELEGGREFRYVKNGATAMAAGKLYQPPVPGANFDELAVPAATAAGATEVTITNGATTVTKDQFKGGWLLVEDDTGEGYTYAIEGNDAEAAGSGALVVRIADPAGLAVAWTTSTTVSLFESRYSGVIIQPSPPTAAVAGVAPGVIPANYYGWVQTKGPCAVLVEGTVVAAKMVMPSASVDGAVAPFTAAGEDEEIVGICLEAVADTEYALIELRLK